MTVQQFSHTTIQLCSHIVIQPFKYSLIYQYS